MSTHRPSASNFHPWYTQRRPHSSLRPKNRSAPRCAQRRSTSPTRPLESRNATSSSPSTVTRTGGPSGSGTSRLSSTGIQKRRNSSPIVVPGPVRVSSWSSSALSMRPPLETPPPSCSRDVDDLADRGTGGRYRRRGGGLSRDRDDGPARRRSPDRRPRRRGDAERGRHLGPRTAGDEADHGPAAGRRVGALLGVGADRVGRDLRDGRPGDQGGPASARGCPARCSASTWRSSSPPCSTPRSPCSP